MMHGPINICYTIGFVKIVLSVSHSVNARKSNLKHTVFIECINRCVDGENFSNTRKTSIIL